jgi:nickel-dependent lactate racemase
MEIELPYGKGRNVKLTIPDKNFLFKAEKIVDSIVPNQEVAIRDSIRDPIGTPPLAELTTREKKIVIVVDDVTRSTPQKIILPVLIDELKRGGSREENIEIVIALGTHRKMSLKEIRDRYGDEVVDHVTISNHDCREENELIEVDKINGFPIMINKKVLEADFVIGVGNIAPHCYAGWSGGGKIIQPGVSGEETIGFTHLMAAKTRPIVNIMGRLDQPIRKAIDDIAIKSRLRFVVNTVLDHEGKISKVVAGDPIKAFETGVGYASKIYCPKIPDHADIVVVSSYPNDIDYWQASKAAAYASACVKKNGCIILITPCPEGVAPTHPIFRDRASLSYWKNLEDIEKGEIDDLVGAADLLSHAQLLEHAEVICWSDGLSREDKTSLRFKNVGSIDEAVAMALKKHGEKSKIGVLCCGDILPRIQ